MARGTAPARCGGEETDVRPPPPHSRCSRRSTPRDRTTPSAGQPRKWRRASRPPPSAFARGKCRIVLSRQLAIVAVGHHWSKPATYHPPPEMFERRLQTCLTHLTG